MNGFVVCEACMSFNAVCDCAPGEAASAPLHRCADRRACLERLRSVYGESASFQEQLKFFTAAELEASP